MKQFLPLMIFLAFFSQAEAQTSHLVINESFETYTNGNLNPQGGWDGSTTNRAQVSNTVTSPAFSYNGYPNGSKYVTLTKGNSRSDPDKDFAGSAVDVFANTTYYMSFLVRVPSTAGTESTSDARPTVSLVSGWGEPVANFYIADNGGSGVKFGIKKDGSTDGTYSSSNYAVNTTYLIVLRYDVVTGGSGNNDRMYMWVNPSLASQPVTGSANATTVSGDDDGYIGFNSFNGLRLTQDQNSASASLDAFKVSYARNFGNNPGAAWDILNPSNSPLPVTFGEIKGYKKDKGVQLDWTVHTEINVSHYDVERSTDGVSFSKIGSVTAQAKDGVLYYTYFDAMIAAGVNFYRVKNVDLDDKYTYSPIVKINAASATTTNEISVYPNPVYDNRVNLQTGSLVKGDYLVEVFNNAGQQVYRKSISHSGGAASHSIQLPATIKTGIYNIRVSGAELKMTKQFLVQ